MSIKREKILWFFSKEFSLSAPSHNLAHPILIWIQDNGLKMRVAFAHTAHTHPGSGKGGRLWTRSLATPCAQKWFNLFREYWNAQFLNEDYWCLASQVYFISNLIIKTKIFHTLFVFNTEGIFCFLFHNLHFWPYRIFSLLWNPPALNRYRNPPALDRYRNPPAMDKIRRAHA